MINGRVRVREGRFYHNTPMSTIVYNLYECMVVRGIGYRKTQEHFNRILKLPEFNIIQHITSGDEFVMVYHNGSDGYLLYNRYDLPKIYSTLCTAQQFREDLLEMCKRFDQAPVKYQE